MGYAHARPEDGRHPPAPALARVRRRLAVQRQARGLRQRRPGADLPGREAAGGGAAARALRRRSTRTTNVLLSATHTHGGPGGYSHYALYNLTMLGFDPQNFEAIVDGIVQSIVRAHDQPGPGHHPHRLGRPARREHQPLARGLPAQPRARSGPATRTTRTRTMTLLRLQGTDGHGGGADQLVRGARHVDGQRQPPHQRRQQGLRLVPLREGQGRRTTLAAKTFVAAFAQSNEGDVTPNIYGGTDGGGADDFESTELSGAQAVRPWRSALYDGATAAAHGRRGLPAHVREDGRGAGGARVRGRRRRARTCQAAIGLSMLAGAEDGPRLRQRGRHVRGRQRPVERVRLRASTTTPARPRSRWCWRWARMTPYPWTPEVLPLQVVTHGQPGAGGGALRDDHHGGPAAARRRCSRSWRPSGVDQVVIAGLSNAYAGYVATREEYAKQDYEGASTHFGPWTLAAVQQEIDEAGGGAAQRAPRCRRARTPRDLRNDADDAADRAWCSTTSCCGWSFGSVVTQRERRRTRGGRRRA